MPALTVFGRRWLVGSDDLPGPAIFLATFHLVRTLYFLVTAPQHRFSLPLWKNPSNGVFLFYFQIWVALLCTWLGEINGPDDCQGVGPYYTAVGGLLAFFTLAFLIEAAIALIGFRGSLFETQKRASIPSLIYALTFCLISQIAFNIYASYLIIQEPPTCTGEGGKPFNPVQVMHGCIWSTWAIIFGTIVFIFSAYNMFPDYKNAEEWERQCECLAWTCVCCPGSVAPTSMASPLTMKHRYKETPGHALQGAIPRRLGAIFALMFSHIDLTPTDCITSFSLALKRQDARRKALFASMSGHGTHFTSGAPGTTTGGTGTTTAGGDASGNAADGVTMGGVNRAASVMRGFGRTHDTRAGTTTGNAGVEEVGMKSPESNDGLLSEVELMEAGKVGSGGGASGGAYVVGAKSPSNEGIDDGISRGLSQEDLEGDLVIDDEEAAFGFTRPLNMVPSDVKTLQEAAYYMKYAFAAYGWMLFVFSKKTTGLFQLCCGRGCGLMSSIMARKHQSTFGLNPLQAPYFNNEAILQATELANEEDLVDVRLEAQVPNVLPYYIAVDHGKKTVVLAFRGSLSMEDIIRDLLFEPADLDLWVEEKRVSGWDAPLPDLKPASETTKYAAHSGIFEAARATLADVQRSGVLAGLLLGPDKKLPDYKLVVVGHSLGAGVAFLVSLRMRQFFPGLKCWSFSPPGGLATAELSSGAVDWCTSVVCGKEMIPRLTLATFERMRDEMVYCAARCRLNKWSIFLSWVSGRTYTEKEMFYTPDDLPEEPQKWLEDYRTSLGSTSKKREYVELATKFGPPGKCLYLKPTGEKAEGERHYLGGIINPLNYTKAVVRDYQGVFVDGEALVEQGIVISGRMMLDHFPDYALAVLRRLASAGGGGAAAHVSDAAGESEMKTRLHTPSPPRSPGFSS
jgi:sn1-specific diacylglycerol lipase